VDNVEINRRDIGDVVVLDIKGVLTAGYGTDHCDELFKNIASRFSKLNRMRLMISNNLEGNEHQYTINDT